MTDEEQGGQAAQEDQPQAAGEVVPSEGNQGETAAEQEQRLAQEGAADTGQSDQPIEAESPAPGSVPAGDPPDGTFEG